MLFTVIQELSKIASPNLPPNSKLKECYDLIISGAEKNEILSKMFGDNQAAETGLRQIKFKLETKLVDDFVSKNVKTGNPALDNASVAYKYYTAGKLLLARQSLTAGTELLEKAYRFAQKGGIIEVALSSAKSLATYYSGISGDYNKYLKYQDAVNNLFSLLQSETIAQSYFNEISYHYTHKWNEQIAEKAFAYCAITENSTDASPKTAIYHFNTLCLANISAINYEGLVDACNQALLHFQKIDSPPRAVFYNFNIKKATGLIHLRRYEEAKECLYQVIGIADKGIYSYCSAYYYLGLLGLHSGNISLTEQALDETIVYWDNLPIHFVEQFKILRAYCALFSSQKFRIGKFLNEVPVYEKDKANANAAILIVQMLHYIKLGKTSEYIERCDALDKYTKKYLSGKKKILAEMLIEVSKGYFKYVTVQHRTKNLVKKLSIQERELGVMPASKIWALVLEWLK